MVAREATLRDNVRTPSARVPLRGWIVSEQPSFVEILERLQRGEQDAATEVFRRYAGRLVALARTRLNPLLRRKAGAEDVVQSAFRSFFEHLANGEFQLKNWESLWGLLVVITLRKCRRQSRHYQGAKRNVHKEVTGPEPFASYDVGAVIVDREPTPHEAAVLAETVDELLQGLDERDRQILRLRLQGHTAIEIGYRVGFTRFTVEGVLKKIRRKLKKQQDLE